MDSAATLFLGVVVAHALAVASPGPDFAMVVRRSLALGRRAGLWTAAGIGLGIVFHVAWGLFGLAALARRMPHLLDLVGVAGGAFLLWTGIGALRSAPREGDKGDAPAAARGGDWRSLLVGLATNVLNPKAMLFFAALFTMVVRSPLDWPLMLALALWLPLSTFGWFALVAIALGRPRARRALLRHAHWIDRAMGVVLIGLGGSLLAGSLP